MLEGNEKLYLGMKITSSVDKRISDGCKIIGWGYNGGHLIFAILVDLNECYTVDFHESKKYHIDSKHIGVSHRVFISYIEVKKFIKKKCYECK
jgi:ribosomal protein L36